MKDFKIPGTELPIIPSNMLYRCTDWGDDVACEWGRLNGVVFYSFGSIIIEGEVWIEAEREHYPGRIFFLFKEKDLISLTNKENKMERQKLTVHVTDVLKIHSIACPDWKKKIANYLSRTDAKQMITFTQEEVDAMFDAATKDQEPKLIEIFGEKEKIDFTKIKTGSKVMIKKTGDYCSSLGPIDFEREVDVVFYDTPHGISASGFFAKSVNSSYMTFHQDKNFVLFTPSGEVNFITKVIKY